MRFQNPSTIFFTFLVCTLLTGCGYEPTNPMPASVDIAWSIGGSTCSARGIATVQVTLSNSLGVQDTVTTGCQVGRVTMKNIPAGVYDIRVDGFPAGNLYPTYGGTQGTVSVHPGDNIIPSVEMSEMPGALDITWRFDDGALCAFAGVETVELVLWDSHSNRTYSESLPCNPSLAQDVAEENIPTRALFSGVRGILVEGLYAGPYTLRALAYGTDRLMGPSHWATAEPTVTHAQIGSIDLVFQTCDALTPCGL